MGRKLANGSKLVLASHNQGKLAELTELLRPFKIEVVSAGALGLPEPEETAPDFAGNARIKALAAANATGLPAFSDDSGFCAAALGGAPGPLSARWAGPGKDFAHAMAQVHERAGDTADRRAWFVPRCVWPGRMAIPRPMSAGSTGPWSGRRAAHMVSAMTQCSSPKAAAKRSARWRRTPNI